MSAPKHHGFVGDGATCEAYDDRHNRVCGYGRGYHPDIKGELSDITKAVQEANLIALVQTALGPVIALMQTHTLTEQRWCGACKRFAIGQAEHTVQVLYENGYRITQSE